MKKLFLVDAYALIFKYYYAFLYSPMRSPDGRNTSAVYGFIKFLNDIISKQKPDCMGVAFDLSGGTFRNELYPLYKANRDETPEDIISSAKIIKEILAAMRIPILQKAGWEADDIIGTLAKRASATKEYEVYIVSPDKDLGQLVDDYIRIYRPGKGGKEYEILGKKEICEHYGISDPLQIIDILAIWGDAADNIPGVDGIGEKGASKLLSQWGTLENIIKNVDELKPKQAEKIKASIEQLKLSKVLTTIALDVPIDVACSDLELQKPDNNALIPIYQNLGFKSMIPNVPVLKQPEKKQEGGYVIHSLFDSPVQVDSTEQKIRIIPEPVIVPETPTPISDINCTEHNYSKVSTEEQASTIVERIRQAGIFAFNVQATSQEPMRADFVSMSVSLSSNEAYLVNDQKLMNLFKDIFLSEGIEKVGHNIKYDIIVLENKLGLKVNGPLWDTMLMHYILFPESRHGLDYLSETLLSYATIQIEKNNFLTDDYCAEKADVTLRLYTILKKMVEESGKMNLYLEIEEPLIQVLADMEHNGVKIDSAKLESIGNNLSGRLDALEKEIKDMAGVSELNINSAKQLGHILYEVLNIDPKPKLTKTKNFKTDEETLLKLKDNHPIVSSILEYRGLRKLMSTYIEALPKLVNPETGKIHTSFNQAVTATGRLSSSNPNLQNIPVRDSEGREIRTAFISSQPGWKIVSADYSQIELRIMAHLSKDSHLLSAFNTGQDIHAATAAKIFKKPVQDVTKAERSRAKVANFGIIYGISSFGLSERLQMSVKEARQFIDDYYLSFPEVRRYIDNSIAKAKVDGYVTTIFSRHRELPEIKSKNAAARKFAERNAVNAPIQGSAADIMKIAMAKVYSELSKKNLRSKMLLQIHDEIVMEVPEDEITLVTEILNDSMSHAANLSVPLEVEIGVGDNWLDAH